MSVDTLPRVLEEKWCVYVGDKIQDWPDLMNPEKWPSRIAFVNEGFSALKGKRNEQDRRSEIKTNGSQRYRYSNVKKTMQMQSDLGPLVQSAHKIWNFPLFRNLSVNDRYAAVRKQRFYYGCLGKGHVIKEIQMDECNHAT